MDGEEEGKEGKEENKGKGENAKETFSLVSTRCKEKTGSRGEQDGDWE